jgi:SAM-dependent methyltransferase
VIAGTEGYAGHARALFLRDEGIPFAEKHQAVLRLLPSEPSAVIDIGSGTGADAAWFASQGHQVVAVEPTGELRLPSMALHSTRSIEWVDDSLPCLAIVGCRRQRFRLVMLTAVWMHLDYKERQVAMPNVASLLASDGTLIMSLRHGPVPDGRRMFEVSAEETILLAQSCGLQEILNVRAQSVQLANRDAGVTWTHLAFVAAPSNALQATCEDARA